MTFKEKIINLRKIRGLTQDEFAKAVGVSRQAVYKWESGQSYPEVPKILEIKLLFNVSIDDLLDDSFDIPLPEKKKRKRAPKQPKETFVAKEERESELQTVSAVTEEPAKEETKEAPVFIAATKEEIAPEAKANEDSTISSEEKKTEEEVKESEEKKQRGFFSRLFGRK